MQVCNYARVKVKLTFMGGAYRDGFCPSLKVKSLKSLPIAGN